MLGSLIVAVQGDSSNRGLNYSILRFSRGTVPSSRKIMTVTLRSLSQTLRLFDTNAFRILTYNRHKSEKVGESATFGLYRNAMQPLCICNGVIRSGSTWSFNVCRGLVQEHATQHNQACGSTYLPADQLETFVTQLWQTAPGSTVVKAHELGPSALAAIHAGSAKAVCTFRDPRDCVASDLEFMGTDLNECILRVNMTLEFLKYFQTTRNILLVRYEDMIADRRREIRRIAAHLGINATASVVSRVDDKTNLQSSRNLCRSLKDRPESSLINIQSHRVDPITHLHENHISDAKVGKWKTIFIPEHGRWLTEYFSSWLLKLGYETPATLAAYLRGNRQAELVPMLRSPALGNSPVALNGGR